MHRGFELIVIACIALLAVSQTASSAVAQSPSVIIADRYVAPDGSIKENAAIVLSSGKIKTIRPAGEYADAPNAVHHSGAVICPGLIDIRSSIGAYGKNVERVFSIDPGASAVDSLDQHHRDFESARSQGITTVMISPRGVNLVSGVAVVLKTAGESAETILRDDGPLVFALGPAVWQKDRAPTSRIGSLSMLRDVLEREGAVSYPRLVSFINGRLDGIVECGQAMDVDAAIRTFAGGGQRSSSPYRMAVVHTSDVHELGAEFARVGWPVVVGPYDFNMSPRMLSTAGAYQSAGAEVAFAGQMPTHSGRALRLTASLAVRHGMSPESARRAMTIVPASIAGVSDRVGSIKPGADADLVVFSGDPLRLDSRVLEVYIDGVRVYRGDMEQSGSRGGL